MWVAWRLYEGGGTRSNGGQQRDVEWADGEIEGYVVILNGQ